MKFFLIFLICCSSLLAGEPKEVNAALESTNLGRREAIIHGAIAAIVITGTVIALILLKKHHHESSYGHQE